MPEYETPNENHGIWIPKAISSRKDLSGTAKLVYGYINGFTANGIEFYACNKTIGEWIGKEADTVSTAVSRLVELGFFDIRLVRNNNGTGRFLTAKIPTQHTAILPRGVGETPVLHTAKTPNNNIEDNINNTILTPSAKEKDDFQKAEPALAAKQNRILAAQIAKKKKDLAVQYPKRFLDWLSAWKYNTKPRQTYVSWLIALEKESIDCLEREASTYRKNAKGFETTPQSWLDGEMWKKAKTPEQKEAERRAEVSRKYAAEEAARRKQFYPTICTPTNSQQSQPNLNQSGKPLSDHAPLAVRQQSTTR